MSLESCNENIYTVKALAFGGQFVCESPQKAKVFAPFLVPGEKVELINIRLGGKVPSGDVGSLVEASPSRVEPHCQYYKTCGGCDLQHINIEGQRGAKISMIQSMLERHAKCKTLSIVDGSAELPALAYRRRSMFHLGQEGQIGFYRRGSRSIVDIENCPISDNKVNTLLHLVRKHTRALGRTCGAIECDGEMNAILIKLRDRNSKDEVSGVLRKFPDSINVHVRERGRDYLYKGGRFRPLHASTTGHFSQVNVEGNRKLIDTVVRLAEGNTLTELYAGSGNLTFPLAQRGAEVVAVESNKYLTARGAEIASEKGLKIQFETMSAERFVRSRRISPTLVMDPPRSGAMEVIKRAELKNVDRIVYVSCNLPTLARDTNLLREKGFELEELIFIDMFPQTHHVETVSLFEPILG